MLQGQPLEWERQERRRDKRASVRQHLSLGSRFPFLQWKESLRAHMDILALKHNVDTFFFFKF